MRLRHTLSLRSRILILVLAVGLAPLATLGFWLSGRTARTGETVLRERLREALVENRTTMEREWVLYRSRLLDLADLGTVSTALAAGALPSEPPPELEEGFHQMDLSLQSLRIRTPGGQWALHRGSQSPSAFGLPLRAQIPLYSRLSGDSLGFMEAAVNINALRARATAPMAGAILTAVDPGTGAVLIPVEMDREMLHSAAFSWNGEPWVVERVDGMEPAVRLIAAAPLDPFASPFRDAGRRGLAVLLTAVALGLAVAWLLSRRLTASLQHLADGAAAVAAGDLSRRVPVRSDDEVGRVGMAFNTMTDNLRRTLDQLAERESLAAVNEFAAALAHEVRNPLTAIQLDLQEVEEQLPPDSPLRPLQTQALEDLRKLDRTVGGALDAARSGRIEPRPMDVTATLDDAARAARPAFDRHGAALRLPYSAEPLMAVGDPDALERVFLNLFLNAAEAAGKGGTVQVELESGHGDVAITVGDDGPGVPAPQVDRVFEPFFTTRPGGTGVGLAVARRIVTAHRGTIELAARPGGGALFTVRLPRA